MAWLYNSACLGQDPNEFYELRIYKISDYEKQTIAENYLSNALLPALERAGSKQVGVFTNQGDVNDHSIFMLIPFRSAEDFYPTERQAEKRQGISGCGCPVL